MKKKYCTPLFEIETINVDDVILVSQTLGDEGFGGFVDYDEFPKFN